MKSPSICLNTDINTNLTSHINHRISLAAGELGPWWKKHSLGNKNCTIDDNDIMTISLSSIPRLNPIINDRVVSFYLSSRLEENSADVLFAPTVISPDLLFQNRALESILQKCDVRTPHWRPSASLKAHLSRAFSELEWLFECDNSELPSSHPPALTLFRSPTRIMIQINLRNWLFLLFLLMPGVGWKMSVWMNRIENTVDIINKFSISNLFAIFFSLWMASCV